MNKFLILFTLLFIISTGSCQNLGKLTVITDIPSSLKENSGIVTFDKETIWTIEDSGNANKIYKVDFKGKIKKGFEVKNAKNHDWEDLTKDKNGHLYIGDFGNNMSKRKNLAIYKLPNPEKEEGGEIDAEKIKFNYPEQKKFPPKKSKLYFDTEAFFHWDNNLYLITKNRSRPYDGKTFIYKVPDKKGEYDAVLVGEFVFCKNQKSCSATSAAVSPNGKTIVVLSYGFLWVITDFKFDDFSKRKIQQIDLGIRTQLESVCFKDENTLLLSDERSKNQGANLYEYTLD